MTDTAATPNQADAPPPDPNAVNITINGRAHVARKGQLLIEAAADAGEYIPRFCYHDRMAPVGKCRMCLVEADSGRGVRLATRLSGGMLAAGALWALGHGVWAQIRAYCG